MDTEEKKSNPNPAPRKPSNDFSRILAEIEAQNSKGTVRYNTNFGTTQKPETINQKIRRQQIENDNKEKDQNLKRITLIVLFCFLGIETIAIFVLAFFQGFTTNGFKLDTWSFRILTVATLGQITAMLTIAVRHLFPQRNK